MQGNLRGIERWNFIYAYCALPGLIAYRQKPIRRNDMCNKNNLMTGIDQFGEWNFGTRITAILQQAAWKKESTRRCRRS